MNDVGLVEGLATVAGASIAVAALVEVTKRILDAFGRWRGKYGQALAAAYGAVGVPAYTTLIHGYDPVALVLAIIVGAEAGVAAGAGYDVVSDSIAAKEPA